MAGWHWQKKKGETFEGEKHASREQADQGRKANRGRQRQDGETEKSLGEKRQTTQRPSVLETTPGNFLRLRAVPPTLPSVPNV